MTQPGMVHEKLTYSVIGAFFEVYNTLGFGFREHLYMKALEREHHGTDPSGKKAGIQNGGGRRIGRMGEILGIAPRAFDCPRPTSEE